MGRKVLEGFFILMAAIILINVAIISLEPYIPYIGLALAIIIIIALGVLAFRLLFNRKRTY